MNSLTNRFASGGPSESSSLLGSGGGGGGSSNYQQSGEYSRFEGETYEKIDEDTERYFRPPTPDENIPDTGGWFTYRFDVNGPFFDILHKRNFSFTSRTSWIDLAYLTYM